MARRRAPVAGEADRRALRLGRPCRLRGRLGLENEAAAETSFVNVPSIPSDFDDVIGHEGRPVGDERERGDAHAFDNDVLIFGDLGMDACGFFQIFLGLEPEPPDAGLFRVRT